MVPVDTCSIGRTLPIYMNISECGSAIVFGNRNISEMSTTNFGRPNIRALSLAIADVWSAPFCRLNIRILPLTIS